MLRFLIPSLPSIKKEMVRIDSERTANRKNATKHFLATLFPKYFQVEEE